MKTLRFVGLALLCLLTTYYSNAQTKQRPVLESNDRPDVISDRELDSIFRDDAKRAWIQDHVVHLFPDSIRIEFPELESRIVLTMVDVNEMTHNIAELNRDLKIFIRDFEMAVPDLTVPHSMNISRKANSDLLVKISDNSGSGTRIISRYDSIVELIPPGWEVNISRKYCQISIYARTFEQLKKLKEQDFAQVAQRVLLDVKGDKPNRNYLATIVMRNGEIENMESSDRRVLDLMELKIGTGVALVNNTFLPILSGSINLTFSDRFNVGRHRLTVHTTNMMFTKVRTDGSLKTNLQKFVNLSYNINLTNSNEDPVFIGLGAGYRVGNDEGPFRGKTMRVFGNCTFGRFTVSPELYITNGVRDAIGGVSVGMSF